MPRRHATDCEDQEQCRGCLPRRAHQSNVLLCEYCHLRLSTSLAEVPGQHTLLLESTIPSAQINARPQPKYGRPDYWRVESHHPRFTYVPGINNSSPQEGEPVRIACLDTARELADLLVEWIEQVCDEHGATHPATVETLAERDGHKRLVYRPANLYREHEGYEWTDPPVRFEVPTAVRWLRGNLERLEQMETIGDMMEDLNTVMGQAHALVPWREQVKTIKGIPCPECHRHTLRQYGGRDTVTCLTKWCKAEIAQGRYLIWAREYEEAPA